MTKLHGREIEEAIVNRNISWSVQKSDDIEKISNSYSFKTFNNAITFINTIAKIIQEHNHHPHIVIDYKTVVITTWTHEVDGITEKDMKLASEIEKVYFVK